MVLEQLTVENYKNCEFREFSFSPKLNCIIGANGIGKTNVLDAIYYTSFCKSYFSHPDISCIREGQSHFYISSTFSKKNVRSELQLSYSCDKLKIVKSDGKKYKKLAEHIGKFPSIMITPSDSILIEGGSVERRRFLDIFISQFDYDYLQNLIKYNRLLDQRNKLLKEPNAFHFKETFEIYDLQIEECALRIFTARQLAVVELVPLFQAFYKRISGGKEDVEVEYSPNCECADLSELLANNFKRDLAARHTTIGVHRDEVEFKLSNRPLKQAGSQGQKKTFLLALKFAKYMAVFNRTGLKPLLLLDDLFDKLDKNRVSSIVDIVSGSEFGQIFITDTDKDSVQSVLDEFAENAQVLML